MAGRTKADTSALRALLSSAPKLQNQPRAVPGQRADSTASMREKIKLAKSNSTGIEQQMRLLKGISRETKRATEQQTHKRDWIRTHAELQKIRTESENSRDAWLKSETYLSPKEGGIAQLHALAREEDEAAAARREWSVEMRSQLRDLHELCAATVANSSRPPVAPGTAKDDAVRAPAARMLVAELSQSLAQQSSRLSSVANALERELQAHTAAILAPDDDSDADADLADLLPPPDADDAGAGGGAGAGGEQPEEENGGALGGDASGTGGDEADDEGNGGSIVRPAAERSEAEKRLLEAIGANLRNEEEAHKEAMAALRFEFFGSTAEAAGGAAGGGEDEDEAAEGEIAGDYFVLEGPPSPDGPSGAAAGGAVGSDATAAAAAAANATATAGASTEQPSLQATSSSTWDRAAQARLAKLEREFRGRSRAALLARLRVELPSFTSEAIEARLELYHQRRAYMSRKRAMLAAWEHRKKALRSSARQLLQEQAASEGRLQLRREEREELASRREELRAVLAVLEKAKMERLEIERAEKAAIAEEAANLAEAQRLKWEAEREHKRALIEGYRREKEDETRKLAQSQLEEAALQQAEKLANAEYNLKRVQYRNELEAQRRKEREAAAEEERRLAEEHVLRLQRFHEGVAAKLNAIADPTKATAASSAQRLAANELFPVYGYADATLMKDMRFKLGHALRNAGLNGTDYARQVLMSERFGGPSRPDAVKSNFALGYDHA